MVVAGDRVSVHLRFKSRFTGRFEDIVGQGQTIDFLAFDNYRLVNGQITENWHLEDNLGLMKQMGILKKSRPSCSSKMHFSEWTETFFLTNKG